VTPVQETFTEAREFTSEFTPRAFPNLIKHLEPTLVELGFNGGQILVEEPQNESQRQVEDELRPRGQDH